MVKAQTPERTIPDVAPLSGRVPVPVFHPKRPFQAGVRKIHPNVRQVGKWTLATPAASGYSRIMARTQQTLRNGRDRPTFV